MSTKDYQGIYRVGKPPNPRRMVQHNAVSWANVEVAISRAGGVASFDELACAVKHHVSGNAGKPHPYQFIIYCVDAGWLERVRIT